MRKIGSILINCLIVFIVCSIVGVCAVLIRQGQAYSVARRNYDKVRSMVVEEAASAWDRHVNISAVEDGVNGKCSWIYLPDSNIDYPVVQGTDNEKYLSVDAYGNASVSGAIFLDCNNNPDLSDSKSIIYGHSMKDGTMFHELHNFTEEEFATSHSKLYIYMDNDKVVEYSLLYVLTADCLDENIYVIDTSQTIDSFCEYAESHASCIYGENSGNNILILSTCIKGNNRRVVVFQKSGEQ